MTKKIITPEETAVTVRPLEVIAIEIRSIDTQARKIVLDSAIEIGKRLTEAKSLVDHGEWGAWLESNVSYSQSTANNFMRVATEYDGANYQTFGNLNYSQAVALLAVPADEREAFAEENKVEDLSIRELQDTIKEKQELERQLKEEQDRLAQQKEKFDQWADEQKQEKDNLDVQYQQEIEQRKKLQADLDAAKEEAEKAETKTDPKTKVELRKAEKAVAEAEKRIADLEANIDTKIKAREDELTSEMAEKEKEIVQRAIEREEAAAKQLAEMEEKLRKNNNVVGIKVKLHYEALVGAFKDLMTAVGELESEDQKAAVKSRITALCDEIKASAV